MKYGPYVGLLIFVVVLVIFIVIIVWLIGSLTGTESSPPPRPGFTASLAADQTLAAATYEPLTGFTVSRDPYSYNGNGDLDLATGEFTVDVTAWYHVTLNVMSDEPAELNVKIVHTRGATVTDVLESNQEVLSADTGLISAHVSGDMFLMAGDVLHAEAYTTGASDLIGDVRTNFSALYINARV